MLEETLGLEIMFQFTHPGRGATSVREGQRPPTNVSIHAPREGCDIDFEAITPLCRSFQFTHPGRGATACGRCASQTERVSIHAPREGCDGRV